MPVCASEAMGRRSTSTMHPSTQPPAHLSTLAPQHPSTSAPSQRAGPELLFFPMPPEGELNELINQPAVGQPGRFPHLRIHADGGEARHGVDLVEVDIAVVARQ